MQTSMHSQIPTLLIGYIFVFVHHYQSRAVVHVIVGSPLVAGMIPLIHILMLAQVIYSQYEWGRTTLVQKYLGGKEEEDEEEENHRDDLTPTPSPTGEEGENQIDWAARRNKAVGRELMTVLNELAYHHSQVTVT